MKSFFKKCFLLFILISVLTFFGCRRGEVSPVTPGEVLPAEELLADMLMELNKPAEALVSYEKDLLKHPKRFNGLYGAAMASEKIHNAEKAKSFYSQLLAIAESPGSNRVELEKAKIFLATGK